MEIIVALLAFFVVFIFVFAAMGIRIIRPWEKALIERLGKYSRTAESGLAVIIPVIEGLTKLDMREMVMDVPPQEVITKDNVVVTVDAVIYTEITDPIKVKYNVENFFFAVIKLAQTNLRNLVGDMTLDESLTSREGINVRLRSILDEATDKWGVRVTRVELQRIEPPRDVTDSMHRQMKAERERRATVLEADGMREAAIMKAEGSKKSQILEAEGRSEAIKRVADAERYKKLTVAQGEGLAIETVYGAIHRGDPTDDLIAIKYLEALQSIANGHATKIFMPFEASGLLSSIGSIAELFKEKLDNGPRRGNADDFRDFVPTTIQTPDRPQTDILEKPVAAPPAEPAPPSDFIPPLPPDLA